MLSATFSSSHRSITSPITSSTDMSVRHLSLNTPVMTAASASVMSGSVAMLPWWSALDAALQFQLGGRGSWDGQDGSHASAYHGAGLNGSWAAFGVVALWLLLELWAFSFSL